MLGISFAANGFLAQILETRFVSQAFSFVLYFSLARSLALGAEAPEAKLKMERSHNEESYSDAMAYNPHLSLSIQQQRQRLPVYKVNP